MIKGMQTIYPADHRAGLISTLEAQQDAGSKKVAAALRFRKVCKVVERICGCPPGYYAKACARARKRVRRGLLQRCHSEGFDEMCACDRSHAKRRAHYDMEMTIYGRGQQIYVLFGSHMSGESALSNHGW